jgi:hypothetical protein
MCGAGIIEPDSENAISPYFDNSRKSCERRSRTVTLGRTGSALICEVDRDDHEEID